MARKLRMAYTFLKVVKTNTHTKYKNKYETQTTCGPRTLKYLLSDPLWRKGILIPSEDGHQEPFSMKAERVVAERSPLRRASGEQDSTPCANRDRGHQLEKPDG